MYAIDFSNPWVRAVDRARRPLPAWAAALVALAASAGFVWAGQGLGRAGVSALLRPGAEGLAPAVAMLAILHISVFTPFYLVAWVLGRLLEARPRPMGWTSGRGTALGLGSGALGLCAALALAAFAGVVRQGSGTPVGGQAIAGAAVALPLIAYQAGAEEVFFRGWLQPRLCARWGGWVGLLAASAIFAFAHLIGVRPSAFGLVNLGLGGVLFGLLALRTGGLWAPFAAHLAWNWTESAVFGADPNPGLGPLGALVDLDLVGSRLWSGGDEGLTGSLAEALVLLALNAAFALLPASRAHSTARDQRV